MTQRTRAHYRKPARRFTAVGVVAAGALLLAACGNDDDMSGMDHGSEASASATAEPGTSAAAADFNDADVAFAQMMIPHHQQALEMAKLADGRASDSEIKELIAQIEKAQDPEIKTMQGWLTSWGKPTKTESMPGMDHSGHGDSGMDGMMSDEDMKELEAAKGTEFDKMFAQMMIDHHNGAISMAEDEQKNGSNADAKKMAAAIIEGQSAEVKQLQSILERL
ncbi:DUF305 domain-containing protein [Streptomyces jeddahensis]|uniref:DUF305 domain-containing protein n=1 Tax=Streptomyces jeddahensis TaxID=1716141 RepID=A0A177HIL7_9ACTN|nr:DUF305 domain-containing protein [Streptomyces jeddahensis]OAH10459.1 hypothetical protein STSP_61970 [Streptomyces jeddahensis]